MLNYFKILKGARNMEEKIKVKLLVDLTKYGEGLVPGTEGYTVGRKGVWSKASDNFITVCFPGVATLDVLWKSLEIIDEEYLKKVEEKNKTFEEKLKTAKDITLNLGPYGGFKYLHFTYKDGDINNSYSVGSKKKAEWFLELFNKYGLEVKEVKEK